MIDQKTLLNNLKTPSLKKPGSVLFLDEINSTNTYLMQHTLQHKQFPQIIIARHQTQGRGRLDKPWADQSGTAFLFSCFYRFPKTQPVSLLPLVVGIALAEVLRDYQPEIGLKWPNDLMYKDKKLGGILIESRFTEDWEVVIGIGLNVHPSTVLGEISQPAVALTSLSARSFDASILLATLLDHLLKNLAEFVSESRAWPIIFNAYDLLKDKAVSVHTAQAIYQGIALGIDSSGALLVQRDNGTLDRVLQATVRKI